jgi:S1-C subfamily serine protease
MNSFFSTTLFTALIFCTSISYSQNKVAQHLQDISVTIKAGNSEGSGVIISRDVLTNKDSKDKMKVNFVWTCAHLVDGLRSTRTVIDGEGKNKTVIEFKDAQIVKELVEGGRKVGELKMDAKVILYSDATDGEDLALLLVRKVGFVDQNTEFFLENKNVEIGEPLLHVGSLLGQAGANSMTNGIMSKVGRVLNIGSGDGVVFDQTTVTAFPGSSGGGVFIKDGRYVGMLVRGSGETFNFIVPIRRMVKWAKKRDIEWAIDATKVVPSLEDIKKIEPEDAELDHKTKGLVPKSLFPFLIRTVEKPRVETLFPFLIRTVEKTEVETNK